MAGVLFDSDVRSKLAANACELRNRDTSLKRARSIVIDRRRNSGVVVMRVGVPKEIKDNEYRVGLIPSTVEELTRRGHQVLVETRAGEGAGIADAEYAEAGAEIVAQAPDVFARAEMIVKVKEPLAPERAMLRADQVLFTY